MKPKDTLDELEEWLRERSMESQEKYRLFRSHDESGGAIDAYDKTLEKIKELRGKGHAKNS